MDYRAESFIGVSDIDDEDGFSCIIAASDEEVGEEGLTCT